ncbi:hypothetical protein FSP39_002904 [Pinctada imbricata]|uniref:Phosphatidylinositol N-acetylglucosaminyltransferase subunit Q n=1 Tax=Pinctada imbricata TaxID=66713 RepID=A0AA88XWS6_PINIB|nr:hypothetical protein FSP39_002904 [Pinctada imbricata]
MRMSVDIKWTVFVPYNILVEPSGYLHGTISCKNKCVTLTSMTPYSCYSVSCDSLVGEWQNLVVRENIISLPICRDNRVRLVRQRNGDLKCYIIEEDTNGEKVACNCVIFNPDEMMSTYFLPDDGVGDNSAIACVYKELRQQEGDKPSWTLFVTGILWLFQSIGILVDNRLMNILGRQIVDSILGLTVMYIVMQEGFSDQISSSILTWADYVAEELSTLLNWLMGAPAGLKLNKQLTEFLGHFFLYHIYLWKGYLSIIQPILGSVIWYTSLLGILGIRAQLCLLQDIVSMMTLHIYCFYVYAARLYKLQVYVLSALWRLFRGKKWNVLRLRVDSAAYDVDQLFLGTLLFTILLFMLPTTALYYIVFTVLRFTVLISQSSLSKIVNFLNAAPVYSLILWILSHRTVAGDLQFSILSQKDTSSQDESVFTLQVCHMPLSKLVLKSQNPFMIKLSTGLSWRNLIGAVMSGDLIYPWVDMDSPKQKRQ